MGSTGYHRRLRQPPASLVLLKVYSITKTIPDWQVREWRCLLLNNKARAIIWTQPTKSIHSYEHTGFETKLSAPTPHAQKADNNMGRAWRLTWGFCAWTRPSPEAAVKLAWAETTGLGLKGFQSWRAELTEKTTADAVTERTHQKVNHRGGDRAALLDKLSSHSHLHQEANLWGKALENSKGAFIHSFLLYQLGA